MAELIIPDSRDRIENSFFARHADVVAKDLLGRVLVRERENAATLYAVLREIAAYEGNQENTSSYEGIRYAPGTIFISKKFGQQILHISTYKFSYPSCINLVSGEIYDGRGFREFTQGPGNLARMLEIDKESFQGLPINLSPLWFAGIPVNQDRILKRDKKIPENCLGYFYFR